MIRLILPLLMCQTTDDDLRLRVAVELELLRLSQVQVVTPTPKPVVAPTYNDRLLKSVADQLPLVVGIGCNPPIGEWLTHRQELPWRGYTSPRIEIKAPSNDGWVYGIGTLPVGASAGEVEDMLASWRGDRLRERLRSTTPQKWNPYNEWSDPKTWQKISALGRSTTTC